MEIGYVHNTAVTHGGTHLCKSLGEVVFKASCVRNICINTLFKGQAFFAAHIVTLPVAGTVGTLAPIFLIVTAVYMHFLSGAFVKTGKISSEHYEICAHCKCKSDVIIVNDAAI